MSAELAHRGARLREPTLAVGDVLCRAGAGQAGRVHDRLDVPVAGRDERDPDATAAPEHTPREAAGADRLVVRMRGDDEQALVRLDLERPRVAGCRAGRHAENEEDERDPECARAA